MTGIRPAAASRSLTSYCLNRCIAFLRAARCYNYSREAPGWTTAVGAISGPLTRRQAKADDTTRPPQCEPWSKSHSAGGGSIYMLGTETEADQAGRRPP